MRRFGNAADAKMFAVLAAANPSNGGNGGTGGNGSGAGGNGGGGKSGGTDTGGSAIAKTAKTQRSRRCRFDGEGNAVAAGTSTASLLSSDSKGENYRFPTDKYEGQG
jgi:hypothetical protein